ncbi:MAG: Sm ribonucleo-like protein [Acidobacteriales bacterium]|nr:Sm ribonucleo-like protein [Terriglobales bacterium]
MPEPAGNRAGIKPQNKDKKAKSRPTEQTFEEPRYLKYLIENDIPVCVRLETNEDFCGTIEYYDSTFIRLTREGEPNLFIFKHEIKYLYEKP